MDINQMQEFIYIFVLNGYCYILDIESTNINVDICEVAKLCDHKIKGITEW